MKAQMALGGRTNPGARPNATDLLHEMSAFAELRGIERPGGRGNELPISGTTQRTWREPIPGSAVKSTLEPVLKVSAGR